MIFECNLSQLLDTCCQSIRCYPPSQSRAGRYFTANANQARCQVSFCGSFSCLRAVNNFYVRSISVANSDQQKDFFPMFSSRKKQKHNADVSSGDGGGCCAGSTDTKSAGDGVENGMDCGDAAPGIGKVAAIIIGALLLMVLLIIH